MITKFKVKNFRSIKEELVLDFSKLSKEKFGEEFIQPVNKENILNMISLIGINGSGKSNVINALTMFSKLVLNSHNHNIDTKLPYFNFSGCDEPTEFSLDFYQKNKKYEYFISYINENIISEKLYSYESAKPSKVFERELDKFSFGGFFSPLKKFEEEINNKVLMVSRGSQRNNETCKEVYSFFSRITNLNKFISSEKPDFDLLKEKVNMDLLKTKLEFADFSICDIETIESIKEVVVFTHGDGKFEQKIEKQTFTDLILHHSCNDKNPMKLNFVAESTGTRNFITIFYNLLKLKEDSIILFDEIENSLNLEIIEFIINEFKLSTHQLIFSTHFADILNLLRADQIKLIIKENSITYLDELYDYVKENDKIRKNYGDYYKVGVFGGQPNVIKESK
jgi:AAA15 family ATPase/GTPase